MSACQLLAAFGWLAVALGVASVQNPRLDASVLASVTILGLIGTGAAHVLNYQIITSEGAAASCLRPGAAARRQVHTPGQARTATRRNNPAN